MGTSSQQASSQSQTNPWAPAQPALKGILSGIEGQMGNYTNIEPMVDLLRSRISDLVMGAIIKEIKRINSYKTIK